MVCIFKGNWQFCFAKSARQDRERAFVVMMQDNDAGSSKDHEAFVIRGTGTLLSRCKLYRGIVCTFSP